MCYFNVPFIFLSSVVTFEVNGLLSHFWERACEEKSYCKNWELFKFEVSKYLRKYGSHFSKSTRAEEEKVIIKIISLSQRSPAGLLGEEKMELIQLQNKLDNIYRLKAEGAFIRSRKNGLRRENRIHPISLDLRNFTLKITLSNTIKH